jgi:hypothetical protein
MTNNLEPSAFSRELARIANIAGVVLRRTGLGSWVVMKHRTSPDIVGTEYADGAAFMIAQDAIVAGHPLYVFDHAFRIPMTSESADVIGTTAIKAIGARAYELEEALRAFIEVAERNDPFSAESTRIREHARKVLQGNTESHDVIVRRVEEKHGHNFFDAWAEGIVDRATREESERARKRAEAIEWSRQGEDIPEDGVLAGVPLPDKKPPKTKPKPIELPPLVRAYDQARAFVQRFLDDHSFNPSNVRIEGRDRDELIKRLAELLIPLLSTQG